MNTQLVRKTDQDHQARVSTTALNTAEIGHIDLGVDRKLFLAQAATLSELQDIRANYGLPVHRENGRDNDYSHQGL